MSYGAWCQERSFIVWTIVVGTVDADLRTKKNISMVRFSGIIEINDGTLAINLFHRFLVYFKVHFLSLLHTKPILYYFLNHFRPPMSNFLCNLMTPRLNGIDTDINCIIIRHASLSSFERVSEIIKFIKKDISFIVQCHMLLYTKYSVQLS